MRQLLFALAWLSACQAATINELIDRSLANHPDLKRAEAKVAEAEESAALQGTLADPVVSIGVNDIRLDDPASRDLEPMQTQSVQFSQQLPLSKRLDIARAKGETGVLLEELLKRKRRLELVYEVRKSAYTWLKLVRDEAILQEYEAVLKELETIHTLYNTESATHYEAALQSSVLAGTVRMRHSETVAKRRRIEAVLGRLTSAEPVTRVDAVSDDVRVPELQSVLKQLESSPEVQIAAARLTLAKQGSDYAKSASTPDIGVSLGYYQRDAFEDYLGVGVSIPLSNAYGRAEKEERKALQSLSAARYDARSARDRVMETMRSTHAELLSLKEQRTIQEGLIRSQQAILDGLDARVQSRQAPLKSRYEVLSKLLESRLRLDDLTLQLQVTRAYLKLLTGDER